MKIVERELKLFVRSGAWITAILFAFIMVFCIGLALTGTINNVPIGISADIDDKESLINKFSDDSRFKIHKTVNEQNARASEEQAAIAELQGEEEAKRQRAAVAGLKGTQRATFGASGVLVDEGSALDVVTDTAGFGELDALTIKRNRQIEAWGYRTQATQYLGQAELSRAGRRSPTQAAVTSLLTSGSTLAGSYAGTRLARG